MKEQLNVDTTKTTTHVSLCAGYGGIDLGLWRAIPNLRTIAFSEIEAFACANLVAKMEEGLMDCAPIWTDLKTFPWSEFRDRVDILTGGYPCQPFSAAGKRLGTEDPRHLWPFIASGIRILRPKLCFFENVEGHISLGLREVIGELESIGYQTAWGVFSASEVGAPHQRKRVFILAERNNEGPSLAGIIARLRTADAFHDAGEELAYDSSAGLQGREWCWKAGTQGEPSGHLAQCSSAMAVSNSLGGAAGISRSLAWNEGIAGVSHNGCHQAWPSRPGEQQFAWEPPRVVTSMENSIGQRGRSESRDALYEGRSASETGGESLPITTGWPPCPAISDDKPAGGDGEPPRVVGNAKHDGSHQRGEESRGEIISSEQGRMQESEGGSSSMGDTEHDGLPTEPIIRGDETTGDERRTQEPHQAGQLTGADRPSDVSSLQGCTSGSESMGNASQREDYGRESRDLAEESRCGTGGDHAADCTGEGMGNAAHANRRPRVSAEEAGAGPEDIWRRRSGESGERQTQSPLGRDADGPAGGLDYAELCVSCDNRTDELRLLGNGVVPATATRAFLTLMDQLLNETP